MDKLIADFQMGTNESVTQFILNFTLALTSMPRGNLQQTNLIGQLQHLQEYLKRRVRKWPTLNEGFQTNECSESEGEQPIIPDPIQVTQISKPNTNELDAVKATIIQLQAKMQAREDDIGEMTVAYMKDIQHLKQMFMRHIEHPEEEIFEVSYYDIKQGLDIEVQQYIVQKLEDAAQLYRKRLGDYRLKLEALKVESESYKHTIQLILHKHDLQSVVKTLFTLEPDVYKIWKQIQDTVGNKQIFQVFEHQKGGYGIDYREIDDIINKSSAGARIYDRQKQQLNDQIRTIIESSHTQINELKTQIQRLEGIIKESRFQNEQLIDQMRLDGMEQIEQQLVDQRRIIEAEHDRKYRKLRKDLISDQQMNVIRRITLKSALNRWCDYARFYELYKERNELSNKSFMELQIRIMNLLQTCNVNFINKDYHKLRIQYNELKVELAQQQQENNGYECKQKQLQFELEKCENNNSMLLQMVNNLRNTNSNYEAAYRVLQKPLSLILIKLGYKVDLKQSIFSLKNINLMQGSIDVIEFVQKLKQLTETEESDITQLINTYIKGQIAVNLIGSASTTHNASTITEMFNIKYDINQESNEVKLEGMTINQHCPVESNKQITNAISELQKQINNESDVAKAQSLKNSIVLQQSMESPINSQVIMQQSKEISQNNVNVVVTNNITNTGNQNRKWIKVNNDNKTSNNVVPQQQIIPQQPPQFGNFQKLAEMIQNKKAQPNNKSTQTNIITKEVSIQTNKQIIQQQQLDSNANVNADVQSKQPPTQEHQDIIFIMPKSRERSQTNSRNYHQIDHPKRSQQRTQSIMEATRYKVRANKAILMDELSAPGYSPRTANPYSHYIDHYHENNKLQFHNYTISKDDHQKQSNRYQVLPQVQCRPLTIPISLHK